LIYLSAVTSTLAGLEVDLFGSLVVRVDGNAVDGLPRKARALLAFLAMHQGKVLLREQLADLLWSESETRLALQGVRNSLVAIGKKLGRPSSFVCADARTVELQGAEVDLVRFSDLARSHELPELEQAGAL
jgi:DNA-binding SARP family transcriptional activator